MSRGTFLLLCTGVIAITAQPQPQISALLVHGYRGSLPYKLTEKACDMAPDQDVVLLAGSVSEMYAMADAMQARCPRALRAGGGAKLRVLPWAANNTAEHVQCAAKLLRPSSSGTALAERVILTQISFEHVMPRLQRTTAVLSQGSEASHFFGSTKLLYAGVPTPAVDAWMHDDEIRYNGTRAILRDARRARTGPCGWSTC